MREEILDMNKARGSAECYGFYCMLKADMRKWALYAFDTHGETIFI
jgi:hypothetical protein